MAKSSFRSARTGRYITSSAAGRSPKTSVKETGGNRGTAERHRSAVTGRYVTEATANRWPSRTVTENGS